MMGMPITLDLADEAPDATLIERVFDDFASVDATFSTYRPESEISRINRGELAPVDASADVHQILALAEQTRRETGGYFDIARDGAIDPSGIVKGWAIQRAAQILWDAGARRFFVDAGGDIQTSGGRADGSPWRVGIRSPFNMHEIVRVVYLTTGAIATSGTSIRGQHIYNPKRPGEPITEIVSLSVVGATIYDADRYATAAFAMGRAGIAFIESLPGFEGYMIDAHGIATYTAGFAQYLAPPTAA